MNKYYYTLDFIAFCIFQDLVLEDENYFNTKSISYLSWLNNFLDIEENYGNIFTKQDKYIRDDYQNIYNPEEFEYVLKLVNSYKEDYLKAYLNHAELLNLLLYFFNYKKKSPKVFVSYFQQLFIYLQKGCDSLKENAMNRIKAYSKLSFFDSDLYDNKNYFQSQYLTSLAKFPYQIIDKFSSYNSLNIDIEKNVNHYLDKIGNNFKPTYFNVVDESVFSLYVYQSITRRGNNGLVDTDFDNLEYFKEKNHGLLSYLNKKGLDDREIDKVSFFLDGKQRFNRDEIVLPVKKIDVFRVLYFLGILNYYSEKENIDFHSETSFNIFQRFGIIESGEKNQFCKYYKNIYNKSSNDYPFKVTKNAYRYIREALKIDFGKTIQIDA